MVNTGKYGEIQAVRYFRDHQYKIVETNYRTRQGEIDIIAEKEGFLVFAEVKTRDVNAIGEAREFVTVPKQRRILSAAMLYLSQHDVSKQPRFDVVEVYTENQKVVKIIHIENAFDAEV